MKPFLLVLTLLLSATVTLADTLPFDLDIKGGGINFHKALELSDVGEGKTEINFDFDDRAGKIFSFDLKYKKLPDNRSYPTNLDITLKDSQGNKLGYLFWANNGVAFLKEMGVFGLIVDVDGQPVDIKFTFDKKTKGAMDIDELSDERFVQDTLVPKHKFQMIRPVILPKVDADTRSISYDLDDHPYAVNYTLKNLDNGLVEFQHNLYQKTNEGEHLLERIYFNAGSLEVLREAMYAGKFFHKEDGTFKLVFYPAFGQTEPPK
jgi:hypothetical protein